jgi:hypothetical protein
LLVTLALGWGVRGTNACAVCVGTDTDGDGVCDDVDNCPTVANPDQGDLDAEASETLVMRTTPSSTRPSSSWRATRA